MIAIKMPMPNNCDNCPCNDDTYKCGATGTVFCEVDDFNEYEKRLPDCPLIDLDAYMDDGK